MSMNGRRRVVITGLGAVTPLGPSVESSWEGLVAGRSGAGPITQFDATDYRVKFACEASEFDPLEWIPYKQARRMDRFAQLIVAAARMAEADSGLEIERESDRVGASVATGIGGPKALQDCYDQLLDRGPARVNPFSIPPSIPNMGATWVSPDPIRRASTRRARCGWRSATPGSIPARSTTSTPTGRRRRSATRARRG